MNTKIIGTVRRKTLLKILSGKKIVGAELINDVQVVDLGDFNRSKAYVAYGGRLIVFFEYATKKTKTKNGERSAAVSTSDCESGNVGSNPTARPMKWYKFDRAKGYRQKRPPIKKWVLVLLPQKDKSRPCSIAVGYRKDGAGCKDSPYFVVPGIGGLPVAWCDCLPSSFDYPRDLIKELET